MTRNTSKSDNHDDIHLGSLRDCFANIPLCLRFDNDLNKSGRRKLLLYWLSSLVIVVLLSACGGQDTRTTPEPFIPPTLSPQQSTPTAQETATELPEPTEVPPCENDLEFLADVTIPDDTVVPPAEEFVKTWLVSNSGTCNWEDDYTLRNTDGIPMGVATIQSLFPARSGSEVEITLTFTAPTDEGRAISKWQAHDPEGNPFGQEFFVQIIVDPSLSNPGGENP